MQKLYSKTLALSIIFDRCVSNNEATFKEKEAIKVLKYEIER